MALLRFKTRLVQLVGKLLGKVSTTCSAHVFLGAGKLRFLLNSPAFLNFDDVHCLLLHGA